MAEIIFTGDLMCSPSITEKTNKNYNILLKIAFASRLKITTLLNY